MDIKKEIEFCESIDCEKNEHGQFIYTSTNNKSSLSLPYILKEYKQWLDECDGKNSETSKATANIPYVSKWDGFSAKNTLFAFVDYCDKHNKFPLQDIDETIDGFLESK